jgi:hypothetical protein
VGNSPRQPEVAGDNEEHSIGSAREVGNPEDRRGATPRALPIEFVELNPLQGFGKAIALWELNRLFVLKLL